MADVYSTVDVLHLTSRKSEKISGTLLDMAKQTVECALFINEFTYSGFTNSAYIWPYDDEKIDDLCLVLTTLRVALDTEVTAQCVFVSMATLWKRLTPSKTLQTLNPCDTPTLRTRCLPGTRRDMLQTITNWLASPSETGNILWLCGVAGSGKSTIATTISEYFSCLRRLGASLSFEQHKSRPHTVIPTIAYWVGLCDARVETAICEAFAANPALLDAPVRIQFEKLLLAPLTAARSHIRGPIVIILDAVDECGDALSRQSFLSVISHFSKLPAVFRFLITSRREPDIEGALLPEFGVTKMELNISSSTSVADVLSYVQHRMHGIQSKRQLDPHWPGDDKIRNLATHAGGHFIWAAAAADFISNGHDPQRHLDTLTQHNPTQPFDLDELYSVILANSGPWSDYTFRLDARAVLGTIVLEGMRMTDEELDTLLSLRKGRSSRRILKYLRCVLRWSPGHCAQPRHSSFGFYLTDPRQSGRQPWFIDSAVHNPLLCLAYLGVLKKQLRFNICGLEDSHVLDADVPNLNEQVTENISPLLSHSSRFWASRLQKDGFDSDILVEVKDFFYNRLLYWLEVLSLLKQVKIASEVLAVMGKYTEDDEKFEEFVDDAVDFVTEFAPVIERSVPHIYLSALPFTPRRSKIFKQYSPSFPHTLKCEGPLVDDWPRVSPPRFPGHSGQVTSLAFSPDSTSFVSGSIDATVQLWDAETGDDMALPYTGHKDWVIALAFSLDSQRILSASYDSTLRTWDTLAPDPPRWPGRSELRVFNFGPPFVHCVAISRDCKLAVTGPSLCVWDAETYMLLAGPLGDSAISIAISSNNKKIVCGHADNTVQVWDAKTGERMAGPFAGHADRISSIAFSHNGTCIVSGSYDTTARLWDAWTGDIDVEAVLHGHRDWVTSVTFSPDGSRVVTGSRDSTIRVWDAHTGRVVAGPFSGHSLCVNVVTFSPDGTRIVSGSRDRTIRVWELTDPQFVNGPLEGDVRLEDGWMVNSSSARMLWVPPWLREGLHFPHNSVVICARGTTTLDLSRFVHGTSWQECIGR
ncbi:hypothetical protein C8R44DRAFT_976510 [Mycena epipterygia]|nr:hypothetical protein C8R44DRAFT_976510 [Mycena epipterygia]